MKCQKCLKEFEDKDLHESHDVPTYLWEGNRQGRKNQADKCGRHYFCKECHDNYENELRTYLRLCAFKFSKRFLKEVKEDGDSIQTI
jgi:hypothetical protein